MSSTSIMRIAIAGSGGLAQHFAHFLNQTPHPFIILSRAPKPQLESLGYQVVVVDYDNQRDLQYALQGTDVVLSTVSGTPQINLIDAASRAHVRRFVPSEFEGPPTRRPPDDPFDRGRAASLERLREYTRSNVRHPMRFTVFTCGVFYERFARGGLASKGIALGSGLEHQGAFIMDVGLNTADVVEFSSPNRHVQICMISLSDLARFVVAALDLRISSWPPEFRVRGDRKTLTQLVDDAQDVKGAGFAITVYSPLELNQHLQHAITYQDHQRVIRLQSLAAAANRHYDFSEPTLNQLVDVEPVPFQDWLRRNWGA